MKLKKLVLQGYKTFASKTEFVFDDGITAVVGPNGSGKSNVADAIRWVLGEQSYSTLRGKKTIDMIFAGSKSRARAGMAQATLTLDNSDGWLPIDFTEVEITRRAYRSGENEYLLNGQKVRLMDINELLAKAGIAEQTYTIIGQGLIDQALSLKADERRALFEEAAGISHYKSRRAASLRRLQDTQRNLERVYDILSELKPRLNSLRRQAERAENYGRVEQDLRQMLRIWYGYQWEQSRSRLRRRRAAAQEAEKSWQETRSQLLTLQDEIETTRNALHDAEEALQNHLGERERVRDQWEKLRRQVAILRERRRALDQQLRESEADLPYLESQKEAATAELNASLSEMELAQGDLNRQQVDLKAFETDFAGHQQRIDTLNADIKKSEQTQRQLRAEIARAQGQIAQLQERLAGRESPTTSAPDGQAAALQAQIEAQGIELNRAGEALADAVLRRDTLREQRGELENALKNNRQLLEEARRALNDSQTTVTRLQTRSELLAQQRPVVTEGDFFERLAERLTIPDGLQDHLDRALGRLADTLIVTQAAEVDRLIGERPTDRQTAVIARDTARPLSENLPSLTDRPGVIGQASDLCRCDPADRPVVEALLGHIFLVETDAVARAIAADLPNGTVAIAPSGLAVQRSGLITMPALDGRDSPLAREQAWRELQAALETAQADQKKRETAAANARQAVETGQSALDENGRQRREVGQAVNEAEQQMRREQRDFDRLTERQELLARQHQRLIDERAELQERIATLEETTLQKEEALVQIESKLAEQEAALAALPVGEAQQQRQVLNQQISGARSIVAGRRAIVDSRQAALRQFEQQIERLQRRREEWRRQLEEISAGTEDAELAGLQKRLDELQEAITPLQETARTHQRTLRQLEHRSGVAQKINHERETTYTQTKVAFTQQETHIDNLQDRIRAELGIVDLSYDDDVRGDTPLPLRDVVDKLPVVDELPEELEGAIQKQRGQLSRMGAINPDAPVEYKEVQERFDFMNQQVDDLTQTEAQLREVIAELDDLTSRAFADTVEKVNIVFGKMFTRLFGGGSGQLMLTDPDDLTVSGVDIIAQLPGRRPQGLALLSGGERSLTAASLIFALLKVSPTPFCAMDEVDAALDEANVNRFRDVLTELSQKTQFIVITHNRGTVQAAQAIYGITMGTDSTSQVISMRPEEYVTQKELV